MTYLEDISRVFGLSLPTYTILETSLKSYMSLKSTFVNGMKSIQTCTISLPLLMTSLCILNSLMMVKTDY